MAKSFELEDIVKRNKKDPRHFLIPSSDEIANLKVGDLVRLFFVFRFKTNDGCRAERMWVEISQINGKYFKGYLTNQPCYIKDLKVGDLIEFASDNIATTIFRGKLFDEALKAIITKRALEKREINWVVRDVPNNEQSSGWQLFYGDENEEYLDNPGNFRIVSLEYVLNFEPLLENVFSSQGNAYEFNNKQNQFVEVTDWQP